MLVTDILKRENNNLNIIRLILACLVIYSHAPCFVDANGHNDFMIRLIGFTDSGNIAVILFFFISGLLVTNSLLVKQDWRKFILARLFRLLPGLAFVLIAMCVVCFFWYSGNDIGRYIHNAIRYIYNDIFLYRNTQFNLENVSFLRMDHPMGGQYADCINGSIWTIPLEFKMYLMTLGFWFIANNIDDRLLSALFIIGLLSPIIFMEHMLSDNIATIYLIPSYSLGGLLAYYKDKIKINLSLTAGFFLLVYVIFSNTIDHWLYILFFCFLTIWLAQTKLLRMFPLKHDISYGVYLWGWPVEQLVGWYFPELSYWSYLMVVYVCVFIIGYISCRLIEEPGMDLLKKINTKF